MLDKLSLNRFLLTLLFSGSILLLLAIGILSYNTTQLWIANRHKAATLRQSLFLYERLFSLLKDAETGQRGYILTNDSTYLAPYQSAVDTIKSYQQAVLQMPLEEEETAEVVTINGLITSKLANLKSTLDIRQTQGMAAGIAAMQNTNGRLLMDRLRTGITNLQQDVTRQIRTADHAMILKSQQVVYIQIAGSICSILLVGWAFWLITRQMKYRQRAMDELEDLNVNLEQRISERTNELQAALEELNASNEELNASNEELFTSNEHQSVLLDKLNQTQQELQMALRAARMGSWQWHLSTGELHWSVGLEAIYGLQPATFDELYGGTFDGWKTFIHPQDIDSFQATITETIQEKGSYSLDFKIVKPDGSISWVNSQGKVVTDSYGEPVRMIGIDTDITERKTTEEKLQQSEERFQIAIKDSPILVFNHDQQLRYTWIYNNPAIGRSEEHMLGKTDQELLMPEEAEPIIALKKDVLKTGIGKQAEMKVTLNGKPTYFSMTIEPLKDADNAIIGLTCAGYDITARKEAEEQIYKSEQLKKAIFEGSADALFLVNAQTSTIEDLNKQAMQLFGYKSKQEVIGRQGEALQKYPYTEEQIQEIMREIQEKKFWSSEIEYISKTGREFWGNAAVSLISVDDNAYFLIRIRDITDAKIWERAIARGQQELLRQKQKTEQVLAILEKDNERKTKELEEARALQMSMLPQEPPQLSNLDMAMYMKTSVEVGGDYYDYKVEADGTITVIVGDATGHGLRAGIVVATVKSYFQTLASQCTVSELLHRISEGIQNLQIRGMYMGVTVIKMKERNVSIASSGMPPLFLYKQELHAVERIMLKGLFLGSALEFPYQYTSMIFEPGDTLLVMSDGLPELFNAGRKMLDYDRIEDHYRQVAHLPAQQIVDNLVQLGNQWAPEKDNEDDITLVAIKAR
jgi:PAS domain S-box-containing protein